MAEAGIAHYSHHTPLVCSSEISQSHKLNGLFLLVPLDHFSSDCIGPTTTRPFNNLKCQFANSLK